MSRYQGILDFEQTLEAKYKDEFADEQELACELFELYLEAVHITIEQWQLKPERRATSELINRIFNDLHAGWELIMGGMLGQGMTLLRDSIECANYIKLFEVDSEFRDQWLDGKHFFLRDVRQRMKKKGISPPPQDHLYKTLSQIYAHPSRKGVTWHVADWYPTGGEHRALYMFGAVDDIPRTRSIAIAALALTSMTIYFLWQEMFPIDKEAHQGWYTRFEVAPKGIYSLETKADQDWLKSNLEQLTIIWQIMYDYLREFLQP